MRYLVAVAMLVGCEVRCGLGNREQRCETTMLKDAPLTVCNEVR